jgi:hypothetical protein
MEGGDKTENDKNAPILKLLWTPDGWRFPLEVPIPDVRRTYYISADTEWALALALWSAKESNV